MARISRDNFHGGYQITGLEDDIARARANAQFEEDMGRITGRMMNAPGESFVYAARTTGRMAVGGVGIGVRMVRDLRFRYIMQAVLHFPMAFFMVLFFAMSYGGVEATSLQGFGQGVLIGLIGAVLWTAVYIILRTRPKLRRMHQY